MLVEFVSNYPIARKISTKFSSIFYVLNGFVNQYKQNLLLCASKDTTNDFKKKSVGICRKCITLQN